MHRRTRNTTDHNEVHAGTCNAHLMAQTPDATKKNGVLLANNDHGLYKFHMEMPSISTPWYIYTSTTRTLASTNTFHTIRSLGMGI